MRTLVDLGDHAGIVSQLRRGTRRRECACSIQFTAGRATATDALAPRHHCAARLLDGHDERQRLAHRHSGPDRDHDRTRRGRYVEHATIHRVSLVTSRIDDPQLVLVTQRVVRFEARECQEAHLLRVVPDDVARHAGGTTLGRRPGPAAHCGTADVEQVLARPVRAELADGGSIFERRQGDQARPPACDGDQQARSGHEPAGSRLAWRQTAARAHPVGGAGIEAASNGPRQWIEPGGGIVTTSRVRARPQGIASLVVVGGSILIHCRT